MSVGSVSHGCTARDEEADKYLRQIKGVCVCVHRVGVVQGEALSVCVFLHRHARQWDDCTTFQASFSGPFTGRVKKKNPGRAASVCVGWRCRFAKATLWKILDFPIFASESILLGAHRNAEIPHNSLNLWPCVGGKPAVCYSQSLSW